MRACSVTQEVSSSSTSQENLTRVMVAGLDSPAQESLRVTTALLVSTRRVMRAAGEMEFDDRFRLALLTR